MLEAQPGDPPCTQQALLQCRLPPARPACRAQDMTLSFRALCKPGSFQIPFSENQCRGPEGPPLPHAIRIDGQAGIWLITLASEG